MKEFKIKLSSNVDELMAQFAAGSKELKEFAKNANAAQGEAEKLSVLKETVAYISQMDKALSKLKKNQPDIFKQIFGSVDKDMKAAMQPLMQMPKEMGTLITKIGKQLDGIRSGKIEATNSEMKALGETFRGVAKALNMEVDLSFLDGTSKAKVKADKLTASMEQLAKAYYNVHKAEVSTGLSLTVPDKPQKKSAPKKKTVAEGDSGGSSSSPSRQTIQTNKDKAISYDELTQKIERYIEIQKRIEDISNQKKKTNEDREMMASLEKEADAIASKLDKIKKGASDILEDLQFGDIDKSGALQKLSDLLGINQTQGIDEAINKVELLSQKINEVFENAKKQKIELSVVITPDNINVRPGEEFATKTSEVLGNILSSVGSKYFIDSHTHKDKSSKYNAVDFQNLVDFKKYGVTSTGSIFGNDGVNTIDLSNISDEDAQKLANVLKSLNKVSFTAQEINDELAKINPKYSEIAKSWAPESFNDLANYLIQIANNADKAITPVERFKNIIQWFSEGKIDFSKYAKELSDFKPENAGDIFNKIVTPVIGGEEVKIDSLQKSLADVLGDIAASSAPIQDTTKDIQGQIETYEELCSVVERYNQLTAKDRRGETSKDEKSELDSIFDRISNINLDADLTNLFDEETLDAQQLANILGIQIPQAIEGANAAGQQLADTFNDIGQATDGAGTAVKKIGDDTSGVDNQIKSYEELIGLLKEYQDLERSKKKLDDSSYGLYNEALSTIDKYGQDDPQTIMKAFNDAWKERKALKDNYIKSPEFIDPNSGASVARKEEIAQKEEEIKRLAAAYIYLGGSIDNFKSKEKQAFATGISNELQEQRTQMQAAEAEIDAYNQKFVDRQRQIAKMIWADGTDIGNTAELIYNVENFKPIEESAQKMANVLGIDIPQAIGTAGASVDELNAKIEKEKQLTQEVVELQRQLESVPANPVDASELESAQREIKNLREEALRLEGALDGWKSSYYDAQNALDNSIPASEVENMVPNDVIDEYRNKVIQLTDESTQLKEILAETQSLLMETQKDLESADKGGVGDSFSAESDAVKTNVQEEIEQLQRLEDKIFDVKHAVEQKIQAFVNERKAVDSNVGAEIEKLESLRKQLEDISTLVNSMKKIKVVADTKSSDKKSSKPLEGEPLKGGQIGMDLGKAAQNANELAAAEQKVEASVEGTNNALDEQVAKTVDLSKQVGTLNFLSKQAKEFEGILSSGWTDEEKEGYEQLIAQINEYKKFKRELTDEELGSIRETINGYRTQAEAVRQVKEAANALDLSEQVGTLNFLAGEAKKAASVLSETNWSDADKEHYEQLIAIIGKYRKSKEKMTDEELDSIRKIVDGYKMQADAVRQAGEETKKAANVFGLKELKSASDRSINLNALTNGFNSKVITDGLENARQAYQRLVEYQQKFNDGHTATDKEKEAYKVLTNQYNAAAKAVEDLIKKSQKMANDSRWSVEIDPSDLDNLEQSMQKAIQASENGRVKFGQFNVETGKLEYSVRRANGTWDHFTAQVDEAGMAVVGLNGKVKTTNGILREFTSGISTKFKTAMQVFSGYDLFFEAIAQVKQGIQYVKDIDLALTELKKVTNETDEVYAHFLQTASQTSAVIGSTVADFTNATADFARLNI